MHVLGPDGDALDALDLVIVRGLPRGSLEQVIFRMDALHVLAEQGVRCVNHPRAIQRTIDKSCTGAALSLAGVPTPPTVRLRAIRRRDGGVRGSWAATSWSSRCSERWATGSCASRIATSRTGCSAPSSSSGGTVHYVQQTLPPAGRRNLRVLVVAGEVAGAMERITLLVARQHRARRPSAGRGP